MDGRESQRLRLLICPCKNGSGKNTNQQPLERRRASKWWSANRAARPDIRLLQQHLCRESSKFRPTGLRAGVIIDFAE